MCLFPHCKVSFIFASLVNPLLSKKLSDRNEGWINDVGGGNCDWRGMFWFCENWIEIEWVRGTEIRVWSAKVYEERVCEL